MRERLNADLERWIGAGLIGADVAERIRAFEVGTPGPRTSRWPVRLALAFGGLMLAAAVLLFVSAHWDALSPSSRFAILLLMVGGLHAGAAALVDRAPALATTLHAVGTVALGGAIFLAAQIFNLDERWSSGILLWAVGAWIGWTLLRDEAQLALVAILTPAWLVSEWAIVSGHDWVTAARVAACGVLLLGLAYFTTPDDTTPERRASTLRWIGALIFLPAMVGLWNAAEIPRFQQGPMPGYERLSTGWQIAGWIAAIAIPLIVAFALRRRAAWMNLVAALWTVAALNLPRAAGDWALYAWFGLGAIALAAWGVVESRTERINAGTAIFAVTVLGFYSSHVMDKLGRSASLAGFGILFLAGGWALERARRRLVIGAKGGSL